MTTDYYEANDREYDETQALLNRPSIRDLVAVLQTPKADLNREGITVVLDDTYFEIMYAHGDIYRVSLGRRPTYIGNIDHADPPEYWDR